MSTENESTRTCMLIETVAKQVKERVSCTSSPVILSPSESDIALSDGHNYLLEHRVTSQGTSNERDRDLLATQAQCRFVF